MSSKPKDLPVPTESSSSEEKLQHELAVVYAALKEAQRQVADLESLVLKFQKGFGAIDKAMQGVIR